MREDAARKQNRKRYFWHRNMQKPGLQLSAEWPKESTAMHILHVSTPVGGYTIAILGNGLDICYPSEHHKLMKCIEEKGLLLSEYPPGTPPSRYTFPRRNRLISSWSDKLIIIQAGKGSGALTTAEYSRKYGRKVEMKAEIMKAEI